MPEPTHEETIRRAARELAHQLRHEAERTRRQRGRISASHAERRAEAIFGALKATAPPEE